MPEVVFDPTAERDIEDIITFYAEHREAARRLIGKILKICDNLALHPYLGRPRSEFLPGLRSFPARPFLVFYYPREYGIEVLHILHGKRNLQSVFPQDSVASLS